MLLINGAAAFINGAQHADQPSWRSLVNRKNAQFSGV